MTAPDIELLERWRAGDEEAGNELVQRHFLSIHRFFTRKLEDAAEDLTQRTFVACVEARDAFSAQSSFKTYLFGIARNQLLMFLRKRGRHDKAMKVEEAAIDQLGLGSPSFLAAMREEQKLLLKALRRLPLDLQITVELHYWEEMSTADIGRVLDVAQGTVKWRLSKARDLLKGHVADLASSDALRKTTLDNFDRWARSLRTDGPPDEAAD